MLVLSRKAGEQIHVGDNVTITLTRIAGSRVAIGIDAPDDILIRRGELEEPVAAVDCVADSPLPHAGNAGPLESLVGNSR